jgi:hypothetical protein
MFPVHLLIERSQHGATLAAQLVLKPLVEMGGQVTDASKLWTHRCGAPIKETQDEDPGRQGPAHTTGGNPFHPFLVGLYTSPASMKPGGDLGRGRLDFQFQDRCDRGKDRLASMVALLPILFSQPAGPLREGGDPASWNDMSC